MKIIVRGKHKILLDDEDYLLVSKYTWTIKKNHKTYYAVRLESINGKRHLVTMHNQIMCPALGFEVDHIDRNGLNNQRNNLRSVTHQKNCTNMGLYVNNKSGYPGVCLIKGTSTWRAQITSNKKRISLGCYPTKEQAIEARKIFDEGNYDKRPTTADKG